MKNIRTCPRREQEKGITLVVALIMLVLVTLLAVTSFDIGKGSLQAVGNMQHRNETLSAAQETFEEVISSIRFFETPSQVFPIPCKPESPNTKCVDVNADGTQDVEVALMPAPTCLQAQNIKASELDLAKVDDLGCAVGTMQNFGLGGAASGDSLCADSLWDMRAEAIDTVTETKVVVTQGVAVRVSNDNIAVSCP